jgi:tetratricopeptide (TPR) repeat protein
MRANIFIVVAALFSLNLLPRVAQAGPEVAPTTMPAASVAIEKLATSDAQIAEAVRVRDAAFATKGDDRAKELAHAIAAFEAVCDYFPNDAQACVTAKLQAGSLYGMTGQPAKAQQAYADAAALAKTNNDPDRQAAALRLGANSMAFGVRNYDEAIKAYLEMISTSKDSPSIAAKAQVELGMTYASQADVLRRKALESLQAVEQKYPKEDASIAKAYQYMVMIAVGGGEVEQAKWYLRRFTSKYGTSSDPGIKDRVAEAKALVDKATSRPTTAPGRNKKGE